MVTPLCLVTSCVLHFALLQLVLMFTRTVWPISIETNAYMHLFQAIRNLFVSPSFERHLTKLFLNTVTKSLGLLRLPWSLSHLTTFSAVLFPCFFSKTCFYSGNVVLLYYKSYSAIMKLKHRRQTFVCVCPYIVSSRTQGKQVRFTLVQSAKWC